MNCKLCADIIISMLLLLLDVTINTNISFIVWTWEKMAEHNFMMWTLNSLLFLFIFFFVLEGDLSDRLSGILPRGCVTYIGDARCQMSA